ncbi:hypothetical protein BOX15_Mlig024322g2 [Macrostomum lignano]|uniref:Amiloride-sensitive sodium channel n=1 Tax=Macrostomum lignano TaxID=282301 RepID=A0A267ECD9_9PLAT|nr:hypothetical protein BOX15_Mlig024322g2 [Macrostomum lignano]
MRTSTLIKYKAVKVQKLDYPAGECADSARLPDILDDDSRYKYTFAACLSSQIGQLIRRQCNCTSAFHVRPPAAGPAAPYCGHYSAENPLDFIRRLDCVRNLNLSNLMASVMHSTCQKPCTTFHYESHLSSSNWTPQVWQIHWMMHISSALKQVMDNPFDQHFSEQLQRLINFTDLESVAGAPEVEALKVFESELAEKMALVTVTRMNYNTLVKQEALQITPSALMSRLGGLGSLTIGVTLTCAFELVELIYLTARRLRRLDQTAEDGGGGGGVDSNGSAAGANQRAVAAATVELLLLQQQAGALASSERQANHVQQGSYYDNCPSG